MFDAHTHFHKFLSPLGTFFFTINLITVTRILALQLNNHRLLYTLLVLFFFSSFLVSPLLFLLSPLCAACSHQLQTVWHERPCFTMNFSRDANAHLKVKFGLDQTTHRCVIWQPNSPDADRWWYRRINRVRRIFFSGERRSISISNFLLFSLRYCCDWLACIWLTWDATI